MFKRFFVDPEDMMAVDLPEPLAKEVRALSEAGDTVGAVRLVRQRTGLDLLPAHRAVQKIAQGLGPVALADDGPGHDPAGISVGRAIGIGFTTTFVLFVTAVMAAFLTGADLTILGASARTVVEGGRRSTELEVNALIPLLIGVVLSGLVWTAGRLRPVRTRDPR